MMLGWVVDDLYGFGVVRGFGGDLIVGGGAGFASGVAGGGLEDALDALEDGLGAPETASGEDGFFFVGGGGEGGVDLWGREWAVGCGGAGEGGEESEGEGERQDGSEWTERCERHRRDLRLSVYETLVGWGWIWGAAEKRLRGSRQQQIPRGNDRKKSNCNCNCQNQYRGPSLRSG